MDFIYFLSGAPASVRSREAIAAGWPDVAEHGSETLTVGEGMFAGEQGVFVRFGGEPIAIDQERQVWEKIDTPDAGGPYWIGFSLDHPPTPAELARPKQLWGTELELADGNSWLVPAIHSPRPGDCYVPQRMRFVKGKFERTSIPEYEEVCRAAARMFDLFYADGDPAKFPDEMECFGFFCQVLGVNYRLGPIEVGMLGLFEVNPLWFQKEFLPAVFGITEFMRQLEQKKRANGSAAPMPLSIGNGGSGSPPTTDPTSST